MWVRSVSGGSPAVHVTAETMCDLGVAGYLSIRDSGEVVWGLGDRVIRYLGYELGDGTVTAFWTSEAIDVRLTASNTTTVNQARTNLVMQISEGICQAWIVPCAVVRVVATLG